MYISLLMHIIYVGLAVTRCLKTKIQTCKKLIASYIYFTLPMAWNYQRNSYTLWESANKAYADNETNCVLTQNT
jgi:hypothetical protein